MVNSIILFAMWFLAFSPVWWDLVPEWLNHSNNSHGLMVPFIAGYLVYHKRRQLQHTASESAGWGLVILIVSLIGYIISYTGMVAVASRIMLVTSLAGIVLWNFGKTKFRVLLFPIFFLLFMIPVPVSIYNTVAFPLQLLATRFAAGIIRLFSIPVYREGNMLYFVTTQLEVAEACSGLRSMTSLVMLSALFSYFLNGRRIWKWVIIISSIPLALLGNIFRVTATGLLANFFGEAVARGFIHEASGILVFLFGFGLLLAEYRYFQFRSAKQELRS